MTTNYTITAGTHPNSIEVYFDSKPALDVIEALKGLKFRWNHKKTCWYGFEKEHTVVDTLIAHGIGENIDGEQIDGANVFTDGYMGGGAFYGSKSNKHLYGADLSKAIRDDIKAAGIKGVTIKCKTYSGGQSIIATVTTTAEDIVPEEEFMAAYTVTGSFGWVDYIDEDGMRQSVHIEGYYTLPDDLRERIRIEHARREYARDYMAEGAINHYHLDEYTGFTEAGRAKLERVQSIIAAYRYDESNSQVDYFDTNFYYDIKTKPAKA